MARVFVAAETALDRKVVIKVLPPETAAQVSLERFKREILLAAKPNPIPESYRRVTPCLVVRGAAKFSNALRV